MNKVEETLWWAFDAIRRAVVRARDLIRKWVRRRIGGPMECKRCGEFQPRGFTDRPCPICKDRWWRERA